MKYYGFASPGLPGCRFGGFGADSLARTLPAATFPDEYTHVCVGMESAVFQSLLQRYYHDTARCIDRPPAGLKVPHA